MEFYDMMVNQLIERVLTAAGPSPEERREIALALMKDAACQALQKIREALDDDSLDDANCFLRIERIVKIYESIGLDGGARHDFS